MYEIKELEQTCEMCPSQWEGSLTDGTWIYIRFRWGHLTVTLNPFTVAHVVVLSVHLGDKLSGFISEHDMLQAIKEVMIMAGSKN